MLSNFQIEIIRLSLLRYIKAGGQFVGAGYLLSFLQQEGFHSLGHDELVAQLQYLVDRKLIAEVEKLISPENKRWRITADGMDFIAKQGQ